MTAIVLPALAALLAILVAAALAGLVSLGRQAGIATTLACALGAVLTMAFLLSGAAPATLVLPIGLTDQGIALALDGLGGMFAAIVLLAGTAVTLGLTDSQPLVALFLAGMLLAVLAADALGLLLGFELMSLASFGLVLRGHDEGTPRAALLYGGMATWAALCTLAALALLSGNAGELGFAAIRLHPATGWRVSAAFVLLLLGPGSKAGLAPLHVWLPPAHGAAPAPASALMSGAMTKVALYVIIRGAFDLAGPATPAWWGMALLVVGTISAVLGALRANVEADIKLVLACSTIENVGLIAAALGLALVARAADLPALSSLALAAALLHALAHGLFKPLLFLCAGAVQHGAGSRQLGRLGGLMRAMPVTGAAALAGVVCLAGVPLAPSFASEWLLFQAAFAAPRIGGLGFQMLVCVCAPLLALAVALAAAAAIRLFGIAFLGRPRTPRGAAAEEAPRLTRWAMAGLGGSCLLLGLFPAFGLALAAPSLRALAGGGLDGRASAWAILPQADGPGYVPLGVALLIGLAVLGTHWLRRARHVPAARLAPAWDGGFAAAPAWMPFGDPLTEYGPDGFAQPIRRAFGSALLVVEETLDMPPPGDPRPARLTLSIHDPAESLLFAPLGQLRAMLSARLDVLQALTARRALTLMFALLLLLLVFVAVARPL